MKVGDVVELKSGGPAMTVKSRSEDSAICTWHSWARTDGIGVCEYSFPLVCLKPYVEPPKGVLLSSAALSNDCAVGVFPIGYPGASK